MVKYLSENAPEVSLKLKFSWGSMPQTPLLGHVLMHTDTHTDGGLTPLPLYFSKHHFCPLLATFLNAALSTCTSTAKLNNEYLHVSKH